MIESAKLNLARRSCAGATIIKSYNGSIFHPCNHGYEEGRLLCLLPLWREPAVATGQYQVRNPAGLYNVVTQDTSPWHLKDWQASQAAADLERARMRPNSGVTTSGRLSLPPLTQGPYSRQHAPYVGVRGPAAPPAPPPLPPAPAQTPIRPPPRNYQTRGSTSNFGGFGGGGRG